MRVKGWDNGIGWNMNQWIRHQLSLTPEWIYNKSEKCLINCLKLNRFIIPPLTIYLNAFCNKNEKKKTIRYSLEKFLKPWTIIYSLKIIINCVISSAISTNYFTMLQIVIQKQISTKRLKVIENLCM